MKHSIPVLHVLFVLLLSGASVAPAYDGSHAQPPWQQASPWPDRIVATFETDPATSVAVSWRTADGIEQPHGGNQK